MGLNLASCFLNSAEQFADKPAVICNERTFTYRGLERWTAQIAEQLQLHGVQKGDHVLLLAPNVPEFTAVYYAVLRIGGVVVPLNTLFLANEIADLIDHSDAKYMVVWHTYAEKGAAAFNQSEACQTLFFVGTKRKDLADELFPEGQHRFVIEELIAQASYSNPSPLGGRVGWGQEALTSSAPTLTLPLRGEGTMCNPPSMREGNYIDGTLNCCQTMPDDTAVILYTSGTTGKSKGVELTHFNLYSNAFYSKGPAILDIQPNNVTLAVLPLFHSFGQTAIQNASLMSGATIVMVPQFEPRRALGEMEKHRVTHTAAVPTMYNLMLQMQRRYHYDLSSFEVAVSGGASLPTAIYHEFEEIFHVKINEGYGLSETSPIACMTPARSGLNKPGSIGPELFGTQVRIVRDDGSFADADEVGELVIRGHNVMKGYYKDPVTTAAAFLPGDWFCSGDIAKMDADGYFYIVDRVKDVIIRAGMNIYPREIEEVLHHHPAVIEAAVVGIPDETLSENVAAFVVLAPDANVSADDLRKYCREHLAIYKCPKTVKFIDQLPKNSTGKIMKRALKKGKVS